MSNITIVIPTSVIPSHPNAEILKLTMGSALQQLPKAPIILTCDGLTSDQEERRPAYTKYIENVVRPIGSDEFIVKVFQEHVHQSGMLLKILPLIRTPLILYLEHDWALGSIEWDILEDLVVSGVANFIKFAPANRIHPLHEHMMGERRIYQGVPLIKTVQYSANPHLASTMWYRSLAPLFEGKTDYIENLLHGPIAMAPWETHKLMIYNPIHGDMKRSFHLDGAHSVLS